MSNPDPDMQAKADDLQQRADAAKRHLAANSKDGSGTYKADPTNFRVTENITVSDPVDALKLAEKQMRQAIDDLDVANATGVPTTSTDLVVTLAPQHKINDPIHYPPDEPPKDAPIRRKRSDAKPPTPPPVLLPPQPKPQAAENIIPHFTEYDSEQFTEFVAEIWTVLGHAPLITIPPDPDATPHGTLSRQYKYRITQRLNWMNRYYAWIVREQFTQRAETADGLEDTFLNDRREQRNPRTPSHLLHTSRTHTTAADRILQKNASQLTQTQVRNKPMPMLQGWPQGIAATYYALFRDNHTSHPSQKRDDTILVLAIKELFPNRQSTSAYDITYWRRRLNAHYFKSVPPPPEGGFKRYRTIIAVNKNMGTQHEQVWECAPSGKRITKLWPLPKPTPPSKRV